MTLTCFIDKAERLVKRLVKDTRGATTIEYILLVALIAVILILILQSFGVTITSVFTDVNSAMDISD